MKCASYLQYAIVEADRADLLTEKLNAELYRLRDKQPKATFDGNIVRISYYESEKLPESLEEEYEAQGVRLTCEDCPFFCPTMKADGTIDKRAKWGHCPLTEYGRTDKRSRACKALFEKLNSGEVKLCLESIE